MRQVSVLSKHVCKNAYKLANKPLSWWLRSSSQNFPSSTLVIITTKSQQLTVYRSDLLDIFLVQCRKSLRVLLPEFLSDMRSEKHALLIILHCRPFSLVTRPQKRGFHPKVLRYLLNE